MSEKKVRVMVDLSMTLLHHGHIRLLKRVHDDGYHVVAALTTDEEILQYKGYHPELSYENRREILEAVKYVDEVVPCPWLISEEFLDEQHCDFLAHGADNYNHIPKERCIIFPRTEGISSSDIRRRVLDSLIMLNLKDRENSGPEKIAKVLIDALKTEFNLK